MQNQNRNNTTLPSEAERAAHIQAGASIFTAKSIFWGGIAVALIGALATILSKSDDGKSQAGNNSGYQQNISSNGGDIESVNMTVEDTAKQTDFNIKIQRLSGTPIESVSFYSDETCTDFLQSDHNNGLYQLRFELKRDAPIVVYAKAKDYECKKLSLTSNDTNPLPFKLPYDCKNGSKRKTEAECQVLGGK